MNKIIILTTILNLLIFQNNSHSTNQNQHSKYDRIFLGSEIIKMEKKFFYSTIKPKTDDRKLIFYQYKIDDPKISITEKNSKLISKNSNYLISSESTINSHSHYSLENTSYPWINSEFYDPKYNCFQDKKYNKIFCYCHNFYKKTLFHPNSPKKIIDEMVFGEIFKFEFKENNTDRNNYEFCHISYSNNYSCYYVKDLEGNYVKNAKNEFFQACEERYEDINYIFKYNADKNCPISSTKNTDGNYYRDCTI